jgi:hypothetical protein
VTANFNRYAYASNNPYARFDPDGREDSCAMVTGSNICGGGSTAAAQMATSAALFVGRQAADAGAERSRYSSDAAKLDPADSAGRSTLKARSRANTPSVVKSIVEATRPSTDANSGTGGRANVSNPSANAGGVALKVGGRVLIAAAVAEQGYKIANSAEPARDVAGAGGMTIGAIGGGEGGAYIGGIIGSFFGPGPGTAVGVVVGGLLGSGIGGYYGENGAEALYDKSKEIR